MPKGNTAHRHTETCQDIYVKYNEKYAGRWRAKSSGVLCAVLPLLCKCLYTHYKATLYSG